ncbi:MAG: dephospho-CoA kinase [Flavobacteriaceae bacterium]|jgi:dephospho-CoA kinase|nr:dephospho-CoA kinase [Flavobacteriaceae bacterium]MDG1961854.1 dephospho-CoA kinase [Flavobacteriaceae bacterium]
MSSLRIKPKVIGLTGGIGSGKSTVATEFAALGVPVYHADERAKILMNMDIELKGKLRDLLGPETYVNGRLNTGFVATHIFADPELLASWNALVHPSVALDFELWLSKQDSIYVVKEVAILYETGGADQCEAVILVTAPKHVRLNRVIERDGATLEQVESRMARQWPDQIKRKKADYVIENEILSETLKQVHQIHQKLTESLAPDQ